jgi:hypothetical protein
MKTIPRDGARPDWQPTRARSRSPSHGTRRNPAGKTGIVLPRPVGGVVNDPNGSFYYRGQYHLFYRHNPHGLGGLFGLNGFHGTALFRGVRIG